MANGLFGGGDGTQANPYLVEDALDFVAINKNNDGMSGKYFKQTQDISLADYADWEPFSFQGFYDGNFKKITNLVCKQNYAGLFYAIYNDTKVENLIVEDAYVQGTGSYSYAGILATYIYSSNTFVKNIKVTGYVLGYYAGGLTYQASSGVEIENVAVNADVHGHSYAGGMCVYASGANFKNCYVKGKVTGDKNNNDDCDVSGWAYSGNGKVTNCYVAAKLYNPSMKQQYSYNRALAPFQRYNEATLSSVYVDIDSKGPQDEWLWYIGYGSGPSNFVRGTDGKLYRNKNYQSYGYSPGGEATYRPTDGMSWKDYWELALENPDPDAPTVAYRTTAQMRQMANYVGWNFDTAWKMIDGQTYPVLFFEPDPTPPYAVVETFIKSNGVWLPVKA